MRIALVCPVYPPEPGGVSDYLEKLGAELVRQGHSLSVWTSCRKPAAVPGIEAFSFPGNWNLETLRKLEGELRKWNPDATVVQFTPYLYGRRGLNPAVPFWMQGLSARLGRAGKPCRTGVMVHELHYPVGLSPDRLAFGTPQLLQFLALFAAAPRVAFTNEVACERYSRIAFRKPVAWIPVGAGVEPDFGENPLPASAVPAGEKILVQFGSAHPSRVFKQSFRALRAANHSGIPSRLVFVGMSPEELKKKLREEGAEELRDRVSAPGYLSARETSAWLSRADLVLAPFIDGISARRSSAISAFAHGKAVATTSGHSTDPSIVWQSFSAVSPAEDTEGFARNVLELLRDPARAQEMGRTARHVFEDTFAWPKIARKLLDWIS